MFLLLAQQHPEDIAHVVPVLSICKLYIKVKKQQQHHHHQFVLMASRRKRHLTRHVVCYCVYC